MKWVLTHEAIATKVIGVQVDLTGVREVGDVNKEKDK